MRQRSSRCAVHAGRNLPDKEFRYLRTVIVTAAVYRGFGSELRLKIAFKLTPPLTFRHWAGVRPYTSPCGLAESCVFIKQSPEPFLCGPCQLLRANLSTGMGHPFFRRYGVRLPSSLTGDHSRALEYSSHLPVSVCGTDTAFLTRGFS